MSCIPTSVARLSFASGLTGWADAGHTEHGQIVTVKGANWDAPFSAAATTTVDWPLAGVAATVTGNVAVEDEAEIVTEGGTVRVGLSLEIATVTPPAGAGLLSVTVHPLVEPALRLGGSHDSGESDNGLRLNVTVAELFQMAVFTAAVMETVWLVVTIPAIAMKVAEEAPPGTTTNVGIINSELLAVNCAVRGLKTVRFNSSVQMLDSADIKDVGLQLRVDDSGATRIVPPVAVV
jgi:hypothetical protein